MAVSGDQSHITTLVAAIFHVAARPQAALDAATNATINLVLVGGGTTMAAGGIGGDEHDRVENMVEHVAGAVLTVVIYCIGDF